MPHEPQIEGDPGAGATAHRAIETNPTHEEISVSNLTRFDRPTCEHCGNQCGPWVPSENFRDERGGQVFRCAPGFGCAAPDSALVDLLCSSCSEVIGTIPAPAPTVAVRCQTCSRAPGCASWCPQGDGHPQEMFDSDRCCYGREQAVPLTIEPSPGLGVIASVEVSPRRQFGGVDSVYLAATQRHGDTDMDMSPAEARQLAALLLQVAEQVESEVRP